MDRSPPFADKILHGLMERTITMMDGFHADSAMSLINEALRHIDPVLQREEQHYFLAYRAEVLYYEGLFNEAIRDLDEAERIAFALKDSTLIANAFNLKGLLHENIQESREALPFMHLALQWFPKRPAARYPVSELYHIHGNMGSYLTKLGSLDSAQYHLQRSHRLAVEAGAERATAVALWSLGNLEILRGDATKALSHYERSWEIADRARDHDIGVDALVGRGLALAAAGRSKASRHALQRAKDYLLSHREQIGLVTQRNFSREAARTYERIGDPASALTEMAEWHRIDSTITGNNIGVALAAQAQLFKYENDLKEERGERDRMAILLASAERTRRWVIIASLLALIALTAIYMINSARQRHKRRLAELDTERVQQERTIAELRVREQVSQDLHDDLGVGLSALKLQCEMSVRKDPSSPSAPMLREQAIVAEELITRMRDIIWALQDDQGSLDDLIAYISAHARNYLDTQGIQLTVDIDDHWPSIQLSTQQRRDIFLIAKEALHNVVKHAGADHVTLRLKWENGLLAQIEDNGNGITTDGKRPGHGLINMNRRSHHLQAALSLSRLPGGKGTLVSLSVPIDRTKVRLS